MKIKIEGYKTARAHLYFSRALFMLLLFIATLYFKKDPVVEPYLETALLALSIVFQIMLINHLSNLHSVLNYFKRSDPKEIFVQDFTQLTLNNIVKIKTYLGGIIIFALSINVMLCVTMPYDKTAIAFWALFNLWGAVLYNKLYTTWVVVTKYCNQKNFHIMIRLSEKIVVKLL